MKLAQRIRTSSRSGAAGVEMRWALALLVLAACRHEEPPPKPKPDAGSPHIVKVDPALMSSGRITTAKVARKTATGVVRLAADVVPSPDGSAEAGTLVPGRIAKFEAREGDKVKAGSVLAWIDSPEAARAAADLIRARARTGAQKRKVDRLGPLVKQEAATQLALEDAQLELDSARADLAAARTVVANLGIAEPPEDGTVVSARVPIRSPVDGTIVERTEPLGAHVTPEMHLFRLLSEGHVLVEARLPDGAGVVLAPGSPARVEQRGAATCTAKVLGTLPQVDAATRTRRVRLAVEEGCKSIVAGAQAEVAIEVPAAGDVLAVNANAVVEVKSAPVVFAKVADGFEVRAVEPGLRIGDDRVILGGLREGDEVVTEGAVLLKGELLRSELQTE